MPHKLLVFHPEPTQGRAMSQHSEKKLGLLKSLKLFFDVNNNDIKVKNVVFAVKDLLLCCFALSTVNILNGLKKGLRNNKHACLSTCTDT